MTEVRINRLWLAVLLAFTARWFMHLPQHPSDTAIDIGVDRAATINLLIATVFGIAAAWHFILWNCGVFALLGQRWRLRALRRVVSRAIRMLSKPPQGGGSGGT